MTPIRLLALAALTGLAALAATTLSARAAPEIFSCPTRVQSDVHHPGGSEWIATNQSSALDRLEVQTIAGRRSMVCVYWLFGSTYWVHRPFPERAVCEINTAERRFYCLD